MKGVVFRSPQSQEEGKVLEVTPLSLSCDRRGLRGKGLAPGCRRRSLLLRASELGCLKQKQLLSSLTPAPGPVSPPALCSPATWGQGSPAAPRCVWRPQLLGVTQGQLLSPRKRQECTGGDTDRKETKRNLSLPRPHHSVWPFCGLVAGFLHTDQFSNTSRVFCSSACSHQSGSRAGLRGDGSISQSCHICAAYCIIVAHTHLQCSRAV